MKIIHVSLLLFIAASLFYTIFSFSLSIPNFVTPAMLCVLIVAFISFRKSKNHAIAAHILTAVLVAGWGRIMYVYGGYNSVTIYYAPLIPLLTLLTLGRTAAISWTFVSLAFFTTICLLTLDVNPYAGAAIGKKHLFIGIVMVVSSLCFLAIGLVYEKTRKTMHAKLIAQQKQLEGALADRQSLLAVVCHDIANPLTLIAGSIDIFNKKGDYSADTTLVCMAKIQRAASFINDIIKSTREMQAMETGKTVLTLEPVSLRKSFDNCFFTFQKVLSDKSITLDFDINGHDDLFVMAEPISFIQSVLNNFVSNAVKFSPRDSTVLVRAFPKGDDVIINIIDNGVGIPEKMIDHLFRSDRSTTRIGTSGEAGSGFGLPLAHSYIMHYGGSVLVKSRTAEANASCTGTYFTITLKKA